MRAWKSHIDRLFLGVGSDLQSSSFRSSFPPIAVPPPFIMAHSGVEKTPDPAMVEDVERSPTKDSYTDYESEFTEAEGRKIIHRIDRRLVVTVGVLYCISLMDRTNLSAAAVAG